MDYVSVPRRALEDKPPRWDFPTGPTRTSLNDDGMLSRGTDTNSEKAWLCSLCTNIHRRRTGTAVALVLSLLRILVRIRRMVYYFLGCRFLGTSGNLCRILNIIPWLFL